MIITVASFKGGVGKTTTAVHLAAHLQESSGPALLVDGDPNRSATGWAKRGGDSFPCEVADLFTAPKLAAGMNHTIIDTQARPGADELESLLKGCDLLVLPTTPKPLDLDALAQTVKLLKSFDTGRYAVLLTMVAGGRKVGEQARGALERLGLTVIARPIRHYVAFERASLAGCPVGEVRGDRNAKEAAADYAAACSEIVKLAGEDSVNA